MNIRTIVLIPCFCLSAKLLVACSMFTGPESVFRLGSSEYLNANTIPVIELPEGMESVPLEPDYYIPPATSVDEFGDPVVLTEYEVSPPEAINIDKGSVGVKIQKVGGERWIALSASTAQVWPRVQAFLSEYGVRAQSSDALKGIVETEWVRFNDDNESISKYRLSVEQGIHPETTEVHVLHLKHEDTEEPESYVWPETSDDPEREAWLVNNLAQTLAKTIDNKAASLLGLRVGADDKVQLVKKQGEPILRLQLPRMRAMATLVHALDQENLVLWEENDASGLFLVGFGNKEASVLRFWGDDDKVDKTSRYSLADYLAHLADQDEVREVFAGRDGAAYGAALADGKGVIVVVQEDGERMDVLVRDVRGRKLEVDRAKTLLRQIRLNLI